MGRQVVASDSDGVLAAYAAAHATAHPDEPIEPPDEVARVGRYGGGEVWRVEDGWGEYYFAEPARGQVAWVASKMPDVMAYHVAEQFRGKIDAKQLGMGNAAWDAAVVAALGGEAVESTEKVGWTDEAREAAARARARSVRTGAGAPQGPHRLTMRFGEIEHTGDMERVAEELHAIGARLVSSRQYDENDEYESGEFVVDVQDVAAFRAAMRASDLHGLGGVLEMVPLPKAPTKKGADMEWTAKRIADLPDSSFAYVEPGGVKDAMGLTSPRSLRHLAYRDEAGAVDVPRLKDAIAAVDRANLPRLTKGRVRERLEKVLKQAEPERPKLVAEENPGGWPTLDPTWKDAGLEAEYARFKQKVIDAVKAASGPGSSVQSLAFDRAQFKATEEAAAWASDHAFKSDVVEETEKSFVIHQADPDQFAHVRVVALTQGVDATVGYSSEAAEAVGKAFTAVAKGLSSADVAAAECGPVTERGDATVWRVRCAGQELYFSQSGGAATHLPEYGAVSKAVRLAEREQFSPVYKAEEQRYTLSVVYPCSKSGALKPDFHGDIMTTVELEKSAWQFMSKGVERIGLMHRPGTQGAGRVVESYIWRGPEWKMDKDAGGTAQSVSPGDWVMGIVWEPEAWAAIKSGEIKGLSLQGAARKTAIDED